MVLLNTKGGLKKIYLIQEIIYHRYLMYNFFYDFTILLLGTNGQASTTLGIRTRQRQ